MASYTYTEPTGGVFAEPSDEVRYLLGDTSPSAPFSLSDAEIEYELAQNARVNLAAANAAYKMGTRYAGESVTSKSVGNLSITKGYAETAARYHALARALRSGAAAGAVASGLFTGDATEPQFTIGQFDNNED